jgi:hypothetical protein
MRGECLEEGRSQVETGENVEHAQITIEHAAAQHRQDRTGGGSTTPAASIEAQDAAYMRAPATRPQPDNDGSVLFQLDTQSFNGSASSALALDHDSDMAISEGRVSFTFETGTVDGRQGLFSKDASGLGDHLSVYIENGELKARLQNETQQRVLSGDVDAGRPCEAAVEFGPGGIRLILDGEVAASDNTFAASWLDNDERMVLGGVGWRSTDGGDRIEDAFHGTISDFTVTDLTDSGSGSEGDPTPDPRPDPTPGPTPDLTPGPRPDPTPGPTPDPATVEMWEFTEWELANPTHSGNPFDVEADVVFTHRETGETIRTGMFYDGGDAWKFRFTGSLEGTWDFVTDSSDADLDGHAGSVAVTANADPDARGFITTHDGKFAVQTDDADTLDPFLFNVYSNLKYSAPTERWVGDVDWPEFPGMVDEYAAAAADVGMEVIFGGIIGNNALELGSIGYSRHSSESPDIEAFRAIEDAIIAAKDEGVYIHFWMWGDEARGWTPSGLDGGINGEVDDRLQDYIAARLGPLTNWTMGYGFDLQEWVTESQISAWAQNMHGEMGWDHLLTARGKDSSALDVRSYSELGHPFADALANIRSDPERAHFFEERDIYLREGGELPLDMETTKDLLWEYAIAGGHGGFWGNAWDSARTAYPEPQHLRTFDSFWNDGDRFLFDLEAREGVVANGVAAATADDAHYVVYVEGTRRVTLDLTELDGTQEVTAVNANAGYAEVSLGTVEAGVHTFSMPSESDWAIAIGDF